MVAVKLFFLLLLLSVEFLRVKRLLMPHFLVIDASMKCVLSRAWVGSRSFQFRCYILFSQKFPVNPSVEGMSVLSLLLSSNLSSSSSL